MQVKTYTNVAKWGETGGEIFISRPSRRSAVTYQLYPHLHLHLRAISPTVTLPASDINAPHPRRRIAPGLWEGEWGGELVDPPSPTLPVPPRGRRTGPRPDPRPPEGGVTGAAEGPCWPPSLVSDGSARDRVSGLWGSRAAKAGRCPAPLRVAFPRRG